MAGNVVRVSVRVRARVRARARVGVGVRLGSLLPIRKHVSLPG